MKILFVMPYMRYSGAPKMMATVANWCAEAGHDVTVTTFFSSEVTQNLNPSVKLHTLGIKRSSSKLINLTIGYAKTRRKIIDYTMREKADLIVSFGDMFSMGAFKSWRKKGQRFIVSERVDPSGNDFWARHRKKVFENASGFVFQTEEAKACFSDSVQKRGVVIPNSFNCSEVLIVPFEERQKKIVCVGRFELKQKRQDVLIRAFELFCKTHTDYQLVFYGDGEDLPKAKAMANKTDVAASIIFAGAVQPIEQYIRDAAMLVMPSDYEGIPNVILEAMNMMIPVVATDCRPGGAKMLLEGQTYGQLVPIGNAEALSQAMLGVAEHQDGAFQKAISAKESLVRFDENKISRMWIQEIESVANYKGEDNGSYKEG